MGMHRQARISAVATLVVTGLLALFAGACTDDLVTMPETGEPPRGRPDPAPLGLIEVTITGIGTADPSATAVQYRDGVAGALAGPAGAGATPGSAGDPGGPGDSGVRFNLDAVTDNPALALDGAGDYVVADGVAEELAGTAALTLEIWVRPEAESGGQQTVLGFHTSAGGNLGILFYEPDRDGFAYYDPAVGYIQTPEGAYPPGPWHHVAVAIDGSNQGTLYIDGAVQGSFSTSVRPEAGGSFSIGQEYDAAAPTDFLLGSVDEVRVWNVARSEAGIQADMGREIDPATPGLVSYYRFGEEAGTTAVDLAGGSDGALQGDPAWGAPGPAIEEATYGDGTIQLEPVATGSFTAGERGAGGFRYLYATFRVRNAQQDGTSYGTERENLTFLAVDTDGTHGHTAISRVATFSGTEITGAQAVTIAEGMIPTGRAFRDGTGQIAAIMPDVLQVLTEDDAAAVDRTGTTATDVFPYGFVVRTPGVTPGSRTLPGSPAADQFDGLVTFAFKVPLQATPADDPFAISVVFLPRDDSETRLTQSLEEQTPEALAAFEARATELGASGVTLLPGSDYEGAIPSRVFCQPTRVAGAEGAAAAVLFPDPPTFLSFSPDPFAPDGSAGRISNNAFFSATFDAPIDGADATSFVVHGAQTGTAFLGEPYTGAGTTTVGSPPGSFFAGEPVEITMTPALGYCPGTAGRVARYRVATTAGSGTFTAGGLLSTHPWPDGVAAGDLDGDGDLDLAVATNAFDSVAIHLNNGNGTFVHAVSYAGGENTDAIAAGDLDGDGDLDLVAGNLGSNDVTVLLNDGAGTVTSNAFGVGNSAFAIAIGDLDGDGDLDLAVSNGDGFDNNVSVLLNDGDGSFAANGVYAVSDGPYSLVAADLDGDGDLDLAVANTNDDGISVLLNHGDGTFAGQTLYHFNAGHNGPTSITAGDLDGDGDLDLATSNFASDDVRVLFNAGDGTFEEPIAGGGADFVYGAGDHPESVTIGDFDGDGDLDLATANRDSDNISVLLNQGDGSYATDVIYGAGDGPQSIVSGDLDGDGDLDLAATSFDSHDITVLLNNE